MPPVEAPPAPLSEAASASGVEGGLLRLLLRLMRLPVVDGRALLLSAFFGSTGGGPFLASAGLGAGAGGRVLGFGATPGTGAALAVGVGGCSGNGEVGGGGGATAVVTAAGALGDLGTG